MTVVAPVTEIGYQQPTDYNWWLYEVETTPELQWPQSVFVYDQMRRTDSQVASVLRAVTLPVRRTPWRIDAAGAPDEVVQFVADDLGLPIVGQNPTPPPRLKDRFSWLEHLREALLMLPMGFSYFEQNYRIDEDGKRAHLRKLALRPARTIEYINVATDGGLISIQQYRRTGVETKPIPVDHLVAYIHDREGGNWLGTSVLRSCYKNWMLKDRLLRVQAQTIERNGMGVPLYKDQPNGTPETLAKGLAMATSWRSGEAAGSAIPNEADLILRGVEGTLPDAEPVVRYHDEAIARAVLAHFLNLGTQTGSWALGTTFADFFTLSLQTLAQQIADTATQHVVEDIVDINFGEDVPAPRITFDEIGSRQQATAQALKSLVDAGLISPDEALQMSIRQQYGLPPMPPVGPGEPAPAVEEVPADEPVMGDPKALAATGGTDWAEELDDGPTWLQADEAFESKHHRGRGGKFAKMSDRLASAIATWLKTDRSEDPFKEFKDREPLRRAAVGQGIKLRRNAHIDEIKRALFDDLHKPGDGKTDVVPDVEVPSVPEKPAAKKPRVRKAAVKKAANTRDEPAKPKAKRIKPAEFLDATDSPAFREEIGSHFAGQYAGYDVVVQRAEQSSDGIEVSGVIKDKSGKEVGDFSRAIIRSDDDGKLIALHQSLILNDDVQGQGFAEAFNRNMVDRYREMGLDRIELEANVDVGGYAWARTGYDFVNDDAAESILRRLRSVPGSDHPEVQQILDRAAKTKFGEPGYPTAYEISQAGRPPGAGKNDTWPGKAAMLGAHWDAVRPL